MTNENDLPIDKEISDLYRMTQDDRTPLALDAAILAQAEAAVSVKTKRPAWLAPVGLAATMLLGVNLALNLKDYSETPEVFSEAGEAATQTFNPSPVSPAPVSPLVEAAELSDLAIDTVAEAPPPSTLRSALESENAPSRSDNFTKALSAQAEAEEARGQVESSRSAPTQNLIDRFSAEQAVSAKEAARVKKTNSAGLSRTESLTDSQTRAEAGFDKAPLIERKLAVAEPAAIPQPAYTTKPKSPPDATSVTTSTRAEEAAEPAETFVIESERYFRNRRKTAADEDSSAPTDDDFQQTLKDQPATVQNHRQLTPEFNVTSSAVGQPALDRLAGNAEVYVCDLEQLQIGSDEIETAKVDARNVEPPLNVVSWVNYIIDRAQANDYVEACTYLAAFEKMYPDVAIFELLPVALAKQK